MEILRHRIQRHGDTVRHRQTEYIDMEILRHRIQRHGDTETQTDRHRHCCKNRGNIPHRFKVPDRQGQKDRQTDTVAD